MKVHLRYNAVYETDGNSLFIHFPDIPNAFTCAYSRKQAIKMAKEVLVLVLHEQKLSELPSPTPKKQMIMEGKNNVISIGITMEVKNGFLLGQNIIDLTSRHETR